MKVDLVYLWVDGSDPVWQAKRQSVVGYEGNTSADCKGRYADNGELKYSLRSVELYAPWIRKIFIVTDNPGIRNRECSMMRELKHGRLSGERISLWSTI